jgi:chitodextrinase
MSCRILALVLTVLAVPGTALAAPDRTKPTTPGTLRVTAITSTSVSLAWGPSTDNSGSFTYTVRESGGAARSVPQTQTAYTWTGLTPNRTYRFTVAAVDGAGNRSAPSNEVTATTPGTVPPATPANLRLANATVNTLTLAWDAVAGATRYELHSPVAATRHTTETSVTVHWLFPDTAYTFTVRAFNAAGTASPASEPLTARTLRDTAAPSVPVVSGRATSPSEIQLTWSASTDNSNYVSYNVDLDGGPWIHMLPGDDTTMQVRNLRDGTSYDLSVRAYDASGNFSEAAHITLSTPASDDTVPPPAPIDLTATRTTSHSVDLAWGPAFMGSDPRTSADFADIFAYEIHMDGEYLQDVAGDWRYLGRLVPFGQVRHLQPGSTHTFTVHSRDQAGNLSAPSNAITVTLPPSTDTTPPVPPTALTGDTSSHCASAFFSWTGGEPGMDVEIYEDGHLLGVWRDEAFNTSFGRRSYTVRFVDQAGNTSADSPPVILDHGMRC